MIFIIFKKNNHIYNQNNLFLNLAKMNLLFLEYPQEILQNQIIILNH